MANPSFEALTGTDPVHFDEEAHLRDGHYSAFDFADGNGFNGSRALPGWSGSGSAGTINPSAAQFPGGVTDGRNTAWINASFSAKGLLTQTLADTFQAGRTYRLSVDVGAPAGVGFPGYFIGLYANGRAVAADTNSVTVATGRFATATVVVTLPADSPFIGEPIEIRLGLPDLKPGQTDFDNVRLTVEPPASIALPVVNPSFEALTGTDPRYFDASGHLLLDHYSTFPGVPSLSIGFYATDAIPGWYGSSPTRPITAGTINYRGSRYFPNGKPDGQNCAFINWVGYISQTLTNTFQAGRTYRLSVDVGVAVGVAFPGYFIGLYADGQVVASDTNSVTVPAGGFATADVVFTLPADSFAVGSPIEIRLGIPGDQPDQTVFDHVRLAMTGAGSSPDCAPVPRGLIAWYRAEGGADDSAGTNAGVFLGPRYAPGKIGSGFDFDGSNEVVVPDAPSLDVSALTVEAWVYPASLDGDVDVIVEKEADGSGSIAFGVGIKGASSQNASSIPVGDLVFQLGGVTGLPSGSSGWTDGGAAVPLNAWSHVAMTYEPGQARIYLNGALVRGFDGLTGTLRQTPGRLKIGSRSGPIGRVPPTSGFNGRIDEVGLYDRSLDANQVAALFRSDSTGKCLPALPVSIVTPPADTTALVGAAAIFSVAATGSRPLSYQWRFQDADIAGATNARLLLPKVGRSAAGKYSVAVCNVAGCAPVVSANLSVDAPAAVVRIGDATAKAPEDFSVPVLLAGNGDENTVGLSVLFDPRLLTFTGTEGGAGAGGSSARLNRSQATNGSIGILVGLQTGARFPRGTNELIRLRFQPKVLASEVVTSLQISDSPAKRQLADVDADPLPVVWTGGNVRIAATDFEGDVGPAPLGDRLVTAADWVLVGRYVAGLEVPADNSLFQRADCAPLSAGGNGRLTAGDWVQTGRFAAGLDPLKPATGPAAPVARGSATSGGGRALPQSPGPRVVSISGGEFPAGQAKEVAVRLAATGDENALAFSVRYDPTRLRFVGADPGADAAGATLNINSLQGSHGRIGLVLALPVSARFAGGDIEVAKFRFTGLPGGTGPLDLAFSDEPVFREVASATAETLPSLWADTVFTIVSRKLSFRVVPNAVGPLIELSWPADATDVSLESATDPAGGRWSTVAAVPVDDGASRSVTLPLSATLSYYRLVVP